VRHGDAYDTGIAVTLSNGNPAPVNVQPAFHWAFWDGGVGGTLVEQGDGVFPGGTITVQANGTWSGWISFHSPKGSGIFNHYDSREDMTVQLTMTRTDGGQVQGAITARTMFRYGVNVTRVTGEDFTGQEWTDLFTAANRTRTIYERRDITFDTDDRYIPRASVGGYEVIDSFDEFHHLLGDWSGPDTNTNIDAFVVQTIAVGGGVDGIDGSIPGPASHSGPDSGLVASKTGFVDANGVRRLQSDYLGMLIGHELGHYLGLSHVSTGGNLMLPSSGTNDITLTYDQYRTMIHHAWVRID
jgi:Matrixin